MHTTRSRRAGAVILALLLGVLPATALRSQAAGARPTDRGATTQPAEPSELWATVDVCNTTKHPDTIGIRGSMPGDGHRRDTMYMRFVVQNYDDAAHRWQNIGLSADSGFVLVGSAAGTRQAGHSFTFKPTTATFTLRGMVEFQWHRGSRTIRSVMVPTTEGHKSFAGAEPKGFSSASCALP